MKPMEIERESFRIILDELGPHSFTSAELEVVQRVIHATADFDFAGLLRFSPGAIAEGVNALRAGCPVVSDVQMIAAGVNHACLRKFGCQIDCLVDDPQVARLARLFDNTRSAIAMRRIGPELNGAVVAVGNAPTALLEVIGLSNDLGIRPALVVGVPVGFVNAAESKQALTRTDLPYITACGRKGGSTVAVAILNALLRLAEE